MTRAAHAAATAMTSPELAEEVLDDLELLRARDPRGLLPAVAGAGAQVRETARLTEEAGLGRVTGGGRPRGLVIVARREGAVAASVLRALLGPSSPVDRRRRPGPDAAGLDRARATSPSSPPAPGPGATPSPRPTRRPAAGSSLLGIGAEDAPLRGGLLRAPGRPTCRCRASRVRHTTLWSLLTPLLLLAAELGLLPEGAADPEAIAAALDEVAAECGPAQESFVNPAKTLALELLDALPVIAAEGPLAGAAATRVADQLATLAGLPATGFRLPDQRVAACAVLGGPLAPGDEDDFFRDRADDTGRRLRLLTIRDDRRRRRTTARGSGSPGRRPRRWSRCCAPPPRTTCPVSGLAEHGDPARYAPAAPAGPAAGRRRLQRRLPGAGAGQREGGADS